MLRVDTFHHYDHDVHGDFGCRCRVRIYDTQGGVIMVLSELYDKPDTTIADSPEEVAAELRQTYGLDADTTRWILHLPAGCNGDDEQGEIWQEVTYGWMGGELPLNPVRTAISVKELETLLGDGLVEG